jgi:3-oxoacyl-[acyl-carrier protein] reductase
MVISLDKTALITGGSGGIGSGICRLFAANGYNVIINYNKSGEKALSLAAELGANALVVRADVGNRHEVNAMVAEARKRFGGVDTLINNAGTALIKLFTDVTEAEWEAMLNVHLTGMFNVTQAVLPDMINRKRGKIINISSIWGVSGASCEVAYSAVKAGMIGFTKALAKETGPSGITVNAIAPGVIDTPMNENISKEDLEEIINATPLIRLGSPRDVAETALFLASEKADFITGQVISPNGGILI